MNSRMNYGPRFKGSAVEIGYGYDRTLDVVTHKDTARMKAILDHQPKYKQELRHYKDSERMKKINAAKHNNHRYEAEQRMEEAVRKAVEMLEFHMNDLIQHRYTSSKPMLVNQNHIHNAIVHLRKKCGVTFADDLHYDHPVQLDIGGCGETQEQMRERIRGERAQQKLLRQRNLKEMAERFIKYKEANNGN